MEIRVRDLLFSMIGMMTTLIHFVFIAGMSAIGGIVWYAWRFGIITPIK